MLTRRPVLLVALAALFAVTAACGQKPGIIDAQTAGAAAPGQLTSTPVVDPETGELIDPSTGEVVSSDGTSGTSGSTGSGTTGSSGSTSGGTTTTGGSGSSSGSSGAPASGDSTGVSDKVIKIGIHAPITGAAPVPSSSFQKGKDLYWEWLQKNNKSVNGRTVEVVFRNDNYNPSQAVAACREMVEDEKVFLLVGIAGTDQIQACARYAASVGVPYVSAGVTEIGLTGLSNYFAIWKSYKQQGPLLADLLVTKLGAKGEKNGMVRFNTPLFQDAHDSWVSAMKSKGAQVQYDRAVSKTAGTSEAQTIATELNQQGIDNVYVLTSPTFFIQLANAAQNQQYHPQWTGIGLSMAIDTVANVACKNNNSINNARFLNPFPAYADSDRFDPDFRKAGGGDDIEFGLWGASKVLEKMFLAGGKDLTRESFVSGNESASTLKTGVYPDVKFSPQNHFGGTAMHLNKAECSGNHWVTEQSFVSDF